jgi:hypothetical protein
MFLTACLALAAAACGGSADDDAVVVPSSMVTGGTGGSEGTSGAEPTVTAPPVSPSSSSTTTTPVTSVAPAPTTTSSAAATTAPSATTPPPGTDPIATAIADLAARLGVDSTAIDVVSAEEVTWPDAAVGCPQPGMSYAQVLVNGSRIVLEAGGVEYHYHSGGGGDPFFCADPQDPVPGGGGDA